MSDGLVSGPDDAARAYRNLLGVFRPGARTSARVFESLCTLEQFLGDLALLPGRCAELLAAPLDALRSVLVGLPDLAEEAVRPSLDFLPDVDAVRERLAEAWHAMSVEERRGFLTSPGVEPRWADCMAPNPVDFTRYERAAFEAAAADPPRSCLVVGIRSAGSYLAPPWSRALRRLGVATRYVTVRPRRAAHGAIDVPDLPAATMVREFGRVLVVDDGVFSGRTLETVRTRIRESQPAGGAEVRSSICFTGDTRGLAHGSTTDPSGPLVLSGCQRKLPFFEGTAPERHFAQAVAELGAFTLADDLPVRPCEPGYWQSYALARVDVPVHVLDGLDHRVRKRRYRLVLVDGDGQRHEVLAKYLGWGALAAEEERLLRDHWYGDAVLGVASGYLFYRWSPGEPTDFLGGRAWPEDDVDTLVADSVTLCRVRSSWSAGAHQWEQRRAKTVARWTDISPALGRYVAGASAYRGDFPLVTIPRNQGHWHHVRLVDGGLRRFHQDVGRWSRVVDPAWDIASVIVELGLDGHRADQLIDGYQHETGDNTVRDRLPLCVAEYALSVLAEFQEHHRGLVGVPVRFLRRDRERLAPFMARLQGVLCAVAPWTGLEDPLPPDLSARMLEGRTS